MKRIYNCLKTMLLLWVAVLSACAAMAYDNGRPDAIWKLIDSYRQEGKQFTRTEVFTPATNTNDIPFLNSYNSFVYNRNIFDYLYSNNQKFISVTVYIDNAPVELLLVKRNFFTDKVVVSRAGENGIEEISNTSDLPELGIHYAGYVVGQENTSVVSLSLFKDEAYGLVSSDIFGNTTIGKLKKDKADDTYISFKSGDLTTEALDKLNQPVCATNTNTPQNGQGTPEPPPIDEDHGGSGGHKKTTLSPSEISGPCVRLFLDVSSDIYNHFSNDINATRQYSIALFAQSATIYLNEEILLHLSQINLWTSGCPYPGTPDNSTNRLNSFNSTWGGGYNGDIAMMIDMGTGGGLASLNNTGTFCGIPKKRMGYDGLNFYGLGANQVTGFNFYIPAYTWQIGSFTHEIGHILGSAHTHDCVWGSGGTNRIDGCGPAAYPLYPTCSGCPGSGSCAAGPIPAQGTIMSYCHLLSNGINLALGFGSAPNTRMRVLILSVPCLGECEQHCPYSYTFYNRAPGSTSVNFPFTWNANYFIHSAAKYILSGADHLEYNAGRYIDLVPGFETQITGGLFLAHIEGCELDHFDESNNSSNPKPGKMTGDDIRISDVHGNKYGISIYPNPTTGAITVIIPGKENYDVRVVNVMGVTVYKATVPGNGKYTMQLQDNVPPGNYTIHITGKDMNFVEKLSVIK